MERVVCSSLHVLSGVLCCLPVCARCSLLCRVWTCVSLYVSPSISLTAVPPLSLVAALQLRRTLRALLRKCLASLLSTAVPPTDALAICVDASAAQHRASILQHILITQLGARLAPSASRSRMFRPSVSTPATTPVSTPVSRSASTLAPEPSDAIDPDSTGDDAEDSLPSPRSWQPPLSSPTQPVSMSASTPRRRDRFIERVRVELGGTAGSGLQAHMVYICTAFFDDVSS
jgi:hypothetical protein